MLSNSLTELIEKLIKEIKKDLRGSKNPILKDMLDEYNGLLLNVENSNNVNDLKFNSTFYLENIENKNHKILKYLYKIEKVYNIMY